MHPVKTVEMSPGRERSQFPLAVCCRGVSVQPMGEMGKSVKGKGGVVLG